jgi:hypothetical protein
VTSRKPSVSLNDTGTWNLESLMRQWLYSPNGSGAPIY